MPSEPGAMSGERRAEIEARCAKATPPPWISDPHTPYERDARNRIIRGPCDTYIAGIGLTYRPVENADFIAHARQDIPDLLAALDAATLRVESALWALGDHPDGSTDIGQRISDIRDEGRAHFHSLTRSGEKIEALRSALACAEAQAEQYRAALEPLLSACEAEFIGGGLTDEFPDDEPVMGGEDKDEVCPITFGLIRAARAAFAPQPPERRADGNTERNEP